jgi:N utilization substance protein B
MTEINKINGRIVSRLLAVQLVYERNFSKTDDVMEMISKRLSNYQECLKEDDDISISSPDKGFLTKLVTRYFEEQQVINKQVSENLAEGWSIEKLDPLLLAIISLGVTEFMFFGDVPTKVVLDQYVTLTKDFYQTQEISFVNGILHNISSKIRS